MGFIKTNSIMFEAKKKNTFETRNDIENLDIGVCL